MQIQILATDTTPHDLMGSRSCFFCPSFLLVTYCVNAAARPALSCFSTRRDEGSAFTGEKMGAVDEFLLFSYSGKHSSSS